MRKRDPVIAATGGAMEIEVEDWCSAYCGRNLPKFEKDLAVRLYSGNAISTFSYAT